MGAGDLKDPNQLIDPKILFILSLPSVSPSQLKDHTKCWCKFNSIGLFIHSQWANKGKQLLCQLFGNLL